MTKLKITVFRNTNPNLTITEISHSLSINTISMPPTTWTLETGTTESKLPPWCTTNGGINQISNLNGHRGITENTLPFMDGNLIKMGRRTLTGKWIVDGKMSTTDLNNRIYWFLKTKPSNLLHTHKELTKIPKKIFTLNQLTNPITIGWTTWLMEKPRRHHS